MLKTIDQLIKNQNRLEVEILVYRKDGTVLQVILLEGFIFTKIKKLLDFSYSEQSILKPKVSFKYDKIKLYCDYKKYTRNKKLKIINSKRKTK